MVRSRIVVVGAGLAGLACAFDLVRSGADVIVLERAPRPGGAVGTLRRDGFTFELGPNTVPASSAHFTRLARDLGLSERMIHTDRTAATRWLWFRGRLVEMPKSPLGLLTTPLLGARSKLCLASEPFRAFVPPDGELEPTFEAFLTERIGREATRLLAGAFVRGVYAAEIDELGARSAFPRLWEATVRGGGLVRGLLFGRKKDGEESRPEDRRIPRSALVSFPAGLQEIVDALARELGPCVRTGVSVERIARHAEGWIVATSDGAAVFADRVVIATQAPAARALLEGLIDTTMLAALRHADVTTVSLGFARGVALPRGFGYLVPPDAQARGSIAPRALGTIFTSNVFTGRAPEGASSIASFYRSSDVAALDASALADLASDDLRLALGAAERPRPTIHHIQRYTDVIPRLEPGHDRRLRALLEMLREREPALHLAGSYAGGVSLDSVIATGRRVANEVRLRERHA